MNMLTARFEVLQFALIDCERGHMPADGLICLRARLTRISKYCKMHYSRACFSNVLCTELIAPHLCLSTIPEKAYLW